jgi:Fe-S cluster biosynthesis and repair protein YggX
MTNENICCFYYKKTLPALSEPPLPGELGKRIVDAISEPAWNAWLERQTMLINEYRLRVIEAKAREFLRKEMLAFLFSEGESTEIKSSGC